MQFARRRSAAVATAHQAAAATQFDDRPTQRLAVVPSNELLPGDWARFHRYGCVGLVMRVSASGRVHLVLFAADGEPAVAWVASEGEVTRCEAPGWARTNGRRS